MELTGKAKKDFEKWRKQQNFHVDAPYFYELKYSMQYGVYVDWFDSVGIELSINNYFNTDDGYTVRDCYVWSVHDLNKTQKQMQGSGYTNTRHEARIEAIKKANEIYNSKD